MESNMAPGAENDPRSGCDDDMVDCPHCEDGYEDIVCGSCSGSGEGMWDGSTCRTCKGRGEGRYECQTCDGAGDIYMSHYDDIKELEKEEDQANE